MYSGFHAHCLPKYGANATREMNYAFASQTVHNLCLVFKQQSILPLNSEWLLDSAAHPPDSQAVS